MSFLVCCCAALATCPAVLSALSTLSRPWSISAVLALFLDPFVLISVIADMTFLPSAFEPLRNSLAAWSDLLLLMSIQLACLWKIQETGMAHCAALPDLDPIHFLAFLMAADMSALDDPAFCVACDQSRGSCGRRYGRTVASWQVFV